MPVHLPSPSAPPGPRRRSGALGIFQLLGLGLLAMIVLFAIIVSIRGLFT